MNIDEDELIISRVQYVNMNSIPDFDVNILSHGRCRENTSIGKSTMEYYAAAISEH